MPLELSLVPAGKCSVTPVMIREALEELEKRRDRVPIAMLLNYLRSRYPVEKDIEELKKELVEQIKRAVRLGLVNLYSDNTLQLATMRWEATIKEFGFN